MKAPETLLYGDEIQTLMTQQKRTEASDTKLLRPLVGCSLYYEIGKECKIRNIINYSILYPISMSMF
jgi:hypothetical protein